MKGKNKCWDCNGDIDEGGKCFCNEGSFDEEGYAVTRVIEDDVEQLAKKFMNKYPLTERMFSSMLSGNYKPNDNSDCYNLFIKCMVEFHKEQSKSKQKESSNWDEIKLFIRNKIIENKQSREFIDWLTCLNMLEDYYNPPVKR